MRLLSRILLPIDFSERSLAAARCSRRLAEHFGAEVTLLHVLPPPQYEFGALEVGGVMIAEAHKIRAERAAGQLESFRNAELAGLNTRQIVLEGDPATRIVDFAQSENVNLIMMPTHGFGAFRRYILGSNTAKVLHDSDCPVWTYVHLDGPAACPGIPVRNILCAVDLGPQSSKALYWAAMLAQEFGARLTILHATAAEPDLAAGDESQAKWRVASRKAAEEELLRLQRFVNVEADLLIEAGEPANVICSAVRRVGAEALVIGRGSASGVYGRLRTNAYAIIRESPCPVVSV